MTNLVGMILKILHYVSMVIGSFPFLFIATTVALGLKFFILAVLIKRGASR